MSSDCRYLIHLIVRGITFRLLGLLSPPINEERPELVIEEAVINGAIANG